jgi:hypothetical protein
MRLGLGRAFFVGFDESWRWRYQVGERDQDRFWLQLVRYAAEEPYQATAGAYSLDVDRAMIGPSEPVRVRARVRSEAEGTPRPASMDVRILLEGAVIRAERLSPVGAAGQGRFETVLKGLGPGDYELQLVTAGQNVENLSVPLHVKESLEAEMADVTGYDRFLQQLASSTGGEALRFDQIQSLPQKISEVQTERSKFAERPLWDSPWLFGFVLACLSAEWAMRKRYGLV